MNNEPKVENVVAILSREYFSYEEIIKDKNITFELLHFLAEENTNFLINSIFEQQKNTRDIIFENVMSLYPMSKFIVKKILENDQSKTVNIIELYNRGEVINKELNKLIQLIKRLSRENPKTLVELEGRNSQLELEIKKCREEINELKISEKKEQKLIDKVEVLKKEYNELKRSYTKEALEEQKIRLSKKITERQKYKDIFEKQNSDIKEIEKELKDIKDGNNNFKKALKELTKVVKTLDGGK